MTDLELSHFSSDDDDGWLFYYKYEGKIASVVRLDKNVPLKIHAYIQALILITALD